jgi:hypothetical protein
VLHAALFAGIGARAGQEDFDQSPLQLSGNRFVEPFPEHRQGSLSGRNVRANGGVVADCAGLARLVVVTRAG